MLPEYDIMKWKTLQLIHTNKNFKAKEILRGIQAGD
jgi:hypothetical protein